ncbi:hypothetical protein ACQWU4_00070 [Chryseobacterium sp. MIQD13]|uniref:hypothetical protein n=1 Tax=Chryseobacterium sp. MIQD13 TaxID=3422310 RepID=UPI003D26E5B3
MKSYSLYFTLLTFVFSCNGSKNDMFKKDEDKTLSIEDMPNKKTVYDTVYTQNTADNMKLITNLKTKLEKAGFSFELQKADRISYNNCEENSIKIIGGDGIRKYFARSSKPEKGTKDFYPDFVIRVYEFSSKAEAEENFKELDKALYSRGKHCNGKAPEKLVINGNEIFHLSTRAEMFRTYMEKYGEMIKNYH